MPGVPIEIPSEIVIVLKITGLPPAAATPSAARRAKRSMCMLHGVTWLQVEAMPICDFRKSAQVKPTACSMARLAARSIPSVTACDQWRSSEGLRAGLRTFFMGGLLLRCRAVYSAGERGATRSRQDDSARATKSRFTAGRGTGTSNHDRTSASSPTPCMKL